jgi:hypothetical protein
MAESRETIKKWGEKTNRCPLCNKNWDAWHEQSGQHLINVRTAAALDGLVGRPLGQVRPLNMGLQGPLIQETALNFWGPQVPLLARRLMSELSKGSRELKRKTSKNGKTYSLLAEQVRTVSTVMASYSSGQGFYQDEDRAIGFDELPEGPHSDMAGPEPPFGRERWPTVQIHAPELPQCTWVVSGGNVMVIWVACIYQSTEIEVWICPVVRSRL